MLFHERPKDKLQELVKDFPELFKNVAPYTKQWKKEKQDAGPYFYFECCNGWYEILRSLLHNIKQRLGRYQEVVRIKARVLEKGDEPPPWIAEFFEKNEDSLATFQIDQIKEKFGGLRFYWSGVENLEDHAFIDGLEHLAESMSFKLCEQCGAPGKCGNVPNNGWIQTLCPEHTKSKTEYFSKESQEKRREERAQAMTKKHSRKDLNGEVS